MSRPRTATGYLAAAPDPAARLRLFCFHHAGGAASAFRGWQRVLGPQVSVVPVQLPGREQRVKEPRFTDRRDLVADLADALEPELRRPYAFYGHSMGALLAHDVSRLRQRRGERPPERLLVGAAPAPDLDPGLDGVVRLPDPELASWMVALGGMSAELLRHPAWVAHAAALVRDDLRLCLGHRATAADEPLPARVDVFAGTDDPLVSRQDALGWVRHTAAGCKVHRVQGGHFFLTDAEFLGLLGRTVADLVRRPEPGTRPLAGSLRPKPIPPL